MDANVIPGDTDACVQHRLGSGHEIEKATKIRMVLEN